MANFGMPNAADIAYRRTLVRLLLIQAALIAAVSVYLVLSKGNEFGLAALYGGAASVAGTLVSGWRVKVAADEAVNNTTLGMAEFYKATALRFITIIALLALGMGVLDMEALGILIGFIAAQAGYFFARPLRAR